MKLKTQLYLLWAMLLSLPSFGQTSFISTYPTANGTRVAATIALSDGNILSGGKTTSFTTGDYDILLMKTDPAGDVLWTKTYGNNEDNEVLSMTALDASSIAVLTKDYISGVPYISFLVIDLTGTITSQKTIAISTGINFAKIIPLSNSRVLVYGTVQNKIVMACLDYSGATVWTKDISVATSGITINYVKATEMANGNIAFVCNTDYVMALPFFSFYLNIVSGTSGSIVNSQLLSTTNDITANKIYCSPTSGDIYVCGVANSSRFLLLKFSSAGVLTWVKSWDPTFLTYGGSLDAFFDPNSDDMTVLGYSNFTGFEIDHFDNNGNFLWSNGSPLTTETPVAITPLSTGDFFVSGTINSVSTGFPDIFISRVINGGQICSNPVNTIPVISNYTASASTVSFNDNGSPSLTSTTITYTSQSPTISKNVSCTFTVGVDEIQTDELFTLRSNIVANELVVETLSSFSENTQIKISDISGRIIQSISLNAASNQTTINTEKMAAGSYLITLFNNGEKLSRKFVVQR